MAESYEPEIEIEPNYIVCFNNIIANRTHGVRGYDTWYTRSGDDQCPIFNCALKVKKYGVILTFTGDGSTKKIAMTAAMKQFIKSLKSHADKPENLYKVTIEGPEYTVTEFGPTLEGAVENAKADAYMHEKGIVSEKIKIICDKLGFNMDYLYQSICIRDNKTQSIVKHYYMTNDDKLNTQTLEECLKYLESL